MKKWGTKLMLVALSLALLGWGESRAQYRPLGDGDHPIKIVCTLKEPVSNSLSAFSFRYRPGTTHLTNLFAMGDRRYILPGRLEAQSESRGENIYVSARVGSHRYLAQIIAGPNGQGLTAWLQMKDSKRGLSLSEPYRCCADAVSIPDGKGSWSCADAQSGHKYLAQVVKTEEGLSDRERDYELRAIESLLYSPLD